MKKVKCTGQILWVYLYEKLSDSELLEFSEFMWNEYIYWEKLSRKKNELKKFDMFCVHIDINLCLAIKIYYTKIKWKNFSFTLFFVFVVFFQLIYGDWTCTVETYV